MCNNYRVLSGRDRAQGSALKGTPKDDQLDLVPGWYRFQEAAGDRIPDKCVPENHCGTLRPGWLSGNHPTFDEGVVTRRVCYHYSKNCCKWTNNIAVKNCGGYFVYKLKRPPRRYLRYCGNGGVGELHGLINCFV